MDRTSIENYCHSLIVIKSMQKLGIINDIEFQKAESLIAKRNCINDGSIYRTNDLINPGFGSINVMNRKEVENDGNEDNETKRVTTIG